MITTSHSSLFNEIYYNYKVYHFAYCDLNNRMLCIGPHVWVLCSKHVTFFYIVEYRNMLFFVLQLINIKLKFELSFAILNAKNYHIFFCLALYSGLWIFILEINRCKGYQDQNKLKTNKPIFLPISIIFSLVFLLTEFVFINCTETCIIIHVGVS